MRYTYLNVRNLDHSFNLRLHEAAYYSGLLDKGAKYLEQACTIYKVIPGEAHPLVSVDIAKFLM